MYFYFLNDLILCKQTFVCNLDFVRPHIKIRFNFFNSKIVSDMDYRKKHALKNQATLAQMLSCLMFFMSSWGHAQSYGTRGMVVSSNAIASQVGVTILKKGGNAIDASIATAFALAVTLPSAGNIGGGGFLVFLKNTGEVTTIDFREKAPLAATPEMYLDPAGHLIEDLNHESIKAIGVPGTVAGLYLAHKKYGKLSWKQLLQPAVELAKNGFAMSWELYQEAQWLSTNAKQTKFMRDFFRDTRGAQIQPGQIWKQAALAKTLALIRDHGQDGFYKGEVAQKIEDYMQKNGGLITKKDLEKYTAVERKPIKGSYKDYEIYSMGPPSSGGIALIEMMNMMELANLDSIEFNSAKYVHVLAEVMRRAFADRAEYLGDPDFNEHIPIEQLCSKSFAKKRFANLDWTKASVSDSSQFGQPYDGNHTTHLSVADSSGNAVSLTYTLEDWYGSKMGSENLGFIFNNEMGDFNPVPGITTTSGQIGTKANLIAPEKRMLSSMTPTIVTKNGKLHLVIGSPGGRTIINTVFQTVLNVLGYGMQIREAIEAMKIHHQWLPDEIVYEEHLMSPDTRNALEKMGHHLVPVQNLGSLMGILYDTQRKLYMGASDSSAPDGAAIAY